MTDCGRRQQPPGGKRQDNYIHNHDDNHDCITDGGVAKQQSTKNIVLVMIAQEKVRRATKGGLHGDNEDI